jgi:hypothetical protein
MLYIPPSDFNWSVDNFGSTFSDTGFGTSVPGAGSANTKGANTQLLTGIANDCYGISICFSGGNASGTIRRQLTDLLIDPAAGVGGAGSSWSVAIANLYANSPCLGADGATGYWYYFPLFIPKGSAIGAAHQDTTIISPALRMGVRLFGLPTRPDLVRVGTRVQTIGAVTGSTSGFSITPGTAALSAYTASMGTLNNDAWWWQLGVGSNDTSMLTNSYWFDLGADTSSTRLLLSGMRYGVVGSVERAYKDAFGIYAPPTTAVQSGSAIVARAAGMFAPDTSMTVIAYALGS